MKAAKERLSLNLDNLSRFLFFLIFLFLPTQLGLHFWPDFSFVNGVRIDYLSPTFYFTDVLIILLFLVVILRRELNLKPNKYFVLFSALFVLSCLLSKNPYAGFIYFLRFIEYSFLAFYLFKKIKVDLVFLKILSIGVLFESFLAIAQFFNKGSLQGIFYFFGERSFVSSTPNIANASINGELILRPYATFSHPNVLAGYLLISVALILFFAKPKEKLGKFLFAVTVIIGSFAVILTFGRIAIIGLFSLYLFKSALYIKNKSFQNLILIGFGVLGLALLTLPFSGRFTELKLNDESIVRRQNLSESSIEMIKDYPLFGVGPNNFLVNLSEYFVGQKQTFFLQPVHNIFLLFLTEFGIFAFLIALVFVVRLFIKTNLEMKFVLFLVLLIGLFDHYFLTLVQGQMLMAVILGISALFKHRS